MSGGPCYRCSYWSTPFALVSLCLQPWWLCSGVPYWPQYKCHELHCSWWHVGDEFVFILVLFPFYSCILTLVLTSFPSKFSPLSRSLRSLFGLRETLSWSWLSTPNNCMAVGMVKMMMMIVLMAMMVQEVQSRLWVISRGRDASGDPANREKDKHGHNIA